MQYCNNKKSDFDNKLMLYYKDKLTNEARNKLKRDTKALQERKNL